VSPVAVSADKRFHRAHVKPARRRSRARHLVWPLAKVVLLVTTAAAVTYRGGAILAESPVLQIDRIVVHGNQRVSSGAVLATLHGLRGENILWTDLDGWRERLLASAWVRDATFRRSLPSTIDVAVAEREPIAIGRLDGRLFLVDERGAVIDEYGPNYADYDLPIVDGLIAPNGDGTVSDQRPGELAARIILSLRAKPNVARRLSQIDVKNPHNAAVILTGDPAVIYVGEDRFLPRIESYLGLAAALRERIANIDYVDLRFDNRIYVRPLGKDGDAMRASGGRARKR
jgi:cell division protein FtsQ